MRHVTHIQSRGKEMTEKQLLDMFKQLWKDNGNMIKDIKTVDLYYNTDESNCYYVVNGKEKGMFTV